MPPRSQETPASREAEIAPEIGAAASVLAQDVPMFVRESVELVKAEARVAVKRAAVKGGLLSAFGYFLILGFFLVCIGLSILISFAADSPSLGPLVVGGALVLIAAIGIPLTLRAGTANNTKAPNAAR